MGMAYEVREQYQARYIRALVHVHELRRNEIEALKREATTYVWGWQDAQSDVQSDSFEAMAFGDAYGTVAALFELQRTGFRPNIASAWKSFREHGHIMDYVAGKRQSVDMIPPVRAEADVVA